MADEIDGGIGDLHPILQHHIVNSLGWNDLRPLQRATIRPIVNGEHILALAPTAGGKTESAVFPILSQILTERRGGLSVLYLCPLRALLNNLHERLEYYGSLCGIRVGLWHGDVGTTPRKRILEDPPEILLTTPESLEAMLISKKTDHRSLFRHLRVVVVDEVHAFGGDDRGWHMLGVLERLTAIAGRDLQRVGLSATVGDPHALLDWLVGSSTAPRRVVAPGVALTPGAPVAAPAAPTEIILDHVGHLANAAKVIANMHLGEKRLVFCDSRASVESLASQLRMHEVTTYVSHASLSIDERRRAEVAFAQARDCVIVSTSTLELGIDVGDLDRVIQINAPSTVASFLQRLGRTGRRPGSLRNMMILTTGDGDETLRAAGLMLLWSRGFVEPVEPPPLPLHLLAHQIMAYCIQEGQVGRNTWQDFIGQLPEYADAIERGDAETVVEHLVATGMLFEDHGMLSIGPEGERSYGFRHFMDMTSAFTSPPTFVARHGANDIGYLDPSALLTNDRRLATVLLGGRSWKITSIDWKRKVAWLEPSDKEGRSRWNGGSGFASFELCDAMRDVASGVDPDGVVLTQRTQTMLCTVRADLSFARPGQTTLVQGDHNAKWWTWAGGRANSTLAQALGPRVSARGNDLFIPIVSGAASWDEIREATKDLHPDALPTPPIAHDYAANLKFADCLPETLALEVARRRLVDPAGVAAAIASMGR